jgi:AraC-like DNA-binding protein
VSAGVRIFAAQRYRLSTLTLRSDALIVVLKGRKTLHAPGLRLQADPGQAALMARGSQWDVVNDPRGQGRYEAVVLAFDDDMVREVSALLPGSAAVTRAKVVAVDRELDEAVQRCLPGDRDTSAVLQRHRAKEVLLLLAERGHRVASVLGLTWAERVRQAVAQRPEADWDAATLARAFHLSESTLRRRLKSEALSLAALVREVRLETALALLQTTPLPVGEIAQRCGWASHSRFSAAFRARWGVAPSVVRS